LIQVTDHGIGIPAHEQARIFEKFYRANVPENHAISGTGLGLALVAHIVHAHHGSVRVDSRPGDGTTFSMRLPMSTPASQRPAGPASLLTVADASTDGPTVPSAAEARS
jgi:signal transduction histidine kinase